MRLHALIAISVLVLAPVPAVSQQTVEDPAAAMKAGKELFEKSCKLCHGLDRSLATTRDAAAWGQIVKRMVAYGAPLNAGQRTHVVRYLATRSAFAGKCGSCHEATRVVGDQPGARDWKALTQRMAGHVKKLEIKGQMPSGGEFAPGELEDIAALLQAVLPNE
jgi:mono/diheme cytochrome c family protein